VWFIKFRMWLAQLECGLVCSPPFNALGKLVKMVKGRRFILKRHFDGLPKPDDFDLMEEELPELKDGEFLFK
jgi:hypothetical protein